MSGCSQAWWLRCGTVFSLVSPSLPSQVTSVPSVPSRPLSSSLVPHRPPSGSTSSPVSPSRYITVIDHAGPCGMQLGQVLSENTAAKEVNLGPGRGYKPEEMSGAGYGQRRTHGPWVAESRQSALVAAGSSRRN